MQQRDAATVVINNVVQAQVSLTTIGVDNPYTGSQYVNIWDALRTSSFFSNYSDMYDQMHLDGVRAKISGVQQAQNSSTYLTPTIYTAWDRNGFDTDPTTTLSTAIISTYSSSYTKPWSLGNSFQQTRSIYPSIMSEKSQYVSPLALVDPSVTDTANTPERNPALPLRSPSIPFKPQLLIGVSTPSALSTGTNILFNIELDIQVTFRGLRKGSVQV